MNTYFSYIDTTLRIIYINRQSTNTVSQRDDLINYLQKSATSRHVKQIVITRHLRSQIDQNPELGYLFVHEYHHFLQSLFYPFLYYLGWLEYDNLMHLRLSLREDETERLSFNTLSATPKVEMNFRYTSYKFRYNWKGDKLQVDEANDDTPSAEVFCLNDLIEDVTTLFQYKLTTPSPSAEDYYEWTRNPTNKGYKRLYKFLVQKKGKKYVYELLPLLVQVSFFTTEPISAFCNAVNMTSLWESFLEPYTKVQLFEFILTQLEKHMGSMLIEANKDIFIHDLKTSVLTYEGVASLVDHNMNNTAIPPYPLSFLFSRFLTQCKDDPEFKYSLLSVDAEGYKKLLALFPPLATHFFFLDLMGRNSFMQLNTQLFESHHPLGIPFDHYLKDIIKIKDTTQSLFTNIHKSLPHHCHHTRCSYFKTDLCRRWSSIPENSEQCSFPSWFEVVYQRRINLEDSTIDKISETEVEESAKLYQMLAFKGREFNYLKEGDKFCLTIDKQELTGDTPLDFKAFINFLLEELKVPLLDLCGAISLDFYGFDEDENEVFEINEIISWLKHSKQMCLELLYYIDFSHPVNHVMVLFPVFVKHTRPDAEDGQLAILFDPQDLERFLLDEIGLIRDFCIANKIYDIDKVLNNLNHINYILNGSKN